MKRTLKGILFGSVIIFGIVNDYSRASIFISVIYMGVFIMDKMEGLLDKIKEENEKNKCGCIRIRKAAKLYKILSSFPTYNVETGEFTEPKKENK